MKKSVIPLLSLMTIVAVAVIAFRIASIYVVTSRVKPQGHGQDVTRNQRAKVNRVKIDSDAIFLRIAAKHQYPDVSERDILEIARDLKVVDPFTSALPRVEASGSLISLGFRDTGTRVGYDPTNGAYSIGTVCVPLFCYPAELQWRHALPSRR